MIKPADTEHQARGHEGGGWTSRDSSSDVFTVSLKRSTSCQQKRFRRNKVPSPDVLQVWNRKYSKCFTPHSSSCMRRVNSLAGSSSVLSSFLINWLSELRTVSQKGIGRSQRKVTEHRWKSKLSDTGPNSSNRVMQRLETCLLSEGCYVCSYFWQLHICTCEQTSVHLQSGGLIHFTFNLVGQFILLNSSQ